MTWDGQQDDTGWVQVTSTVTGSWGVKYRVRNGEVTVLVSGTRNTTSGTTAPLATAVIPAEYCPPVNVRGAGFFNGHAGIISVLPSGDVEAIQQSGAVQATLSGTVKYPVS